MGEGLYEVLALLPVASDFTLRTGVKHFASPRPGRSPLRAELAVGGRRHPSGIRVYYEGWAVVGWLESGRVVRAESREHARHNDPPASATIVSNCTRRLTVWADPDPEFEHWDHFNEFVDELQERFGALIYDEATGGWWQPRPSAADRHAVCC